MSIIHVNNAQVILGELLEILDVVEESGNGKAFHPTNILTCRVMAGVKLEELLIKARKELKLEPRKSLDEINRDWSGENDVPSSLSSEFRKGVKTMFDMLMCHAANNYHGRPAIDEICQRENKLIKEWALEALKTVSLEDYDHWIGIDEAYRLGRLVGLRQDTKDLNPTGKPFWTKFKELFASKTKV